MRKNLDRLLSFEWLERHIDILAGVLVVAAVSLISGLFFIATTRNPIPLFGFRVFAPSTAIETYAEFIVVATYYVLGTAGLALYFMASRGTMSQRGARYAFLGSAALLIIAILGLIAGLLSKRGV